MRIYDIIAKKRDGLALSEEEIRFFVRQYTQGMIPDYQASALLMAICINGMDLQKAFPGHELTCQHRHLGTQGQAWQKIINNFFINNRMSY